MECGDQILHENKQVSDAPEVNNTHTISINTISSYSLSCGIFGKPISFFVPFGAEVSLLNNEEWDKIKTEGKELIDNPVVSHQIVGVDGIPIKVWLQLCRSF